MNDVNEIQKKYEQEIKDLNSKYEMLSKEVEKLIKNEESLRTSVNTIYNSFEKLNQNVEMILSKMDSLQNANFEQQQGPKMDLNIGRKLGRGLRRLTVGTVGFVLGVRDRTAETVANFKEGFEDIVAEAQYNNRKKKLAVEVE